MEGGGDVTFGVMFRAVLELAPRLFRFVHSTYSSPSILFWGDKTIQSAEGVQQGDPLGPLLFCLTIHQLGPQLISELQKTFLMSFSKEGILLTQTMRKVVCNIWRLALEFW